MDAEPKKVVGLKYAPGEGLPEVVLKGYGAVADEILSRRGYSGQPPLIRDRELAGKLYRLPMDAPIGPELFEIVAIVLAHVFAVNSSLRQGEH